MSPWFVFEWFVMHPMNVFPVSIQALSVNLLTYLSPSSHRLMGYDCFMNLSLPNARIEVPGTGPHQVESCILRGATVLSFESVNLFTDS
jgi:hypothetical protein